MDLGDSLPELSNREEFDVLTVLCCIQYGLELRQVCLRIESDLILNRDVERQSTRGLLSWKRDQDAMRLIQVLTGEIKKGRSFLEYGGENPLPNQGQINWQDSKLTASSPLMYIPLSPYVG
jgi:hypothetical protein